MRKPSPLAVILLTIFVDMIGIGIMIPVFPQLFVNAESPAYMLAPGTPISTVTRPSGSIRGTMTPARVPTRISVLAVKPRSRT